MASMRIDPAPRALALGVGAVLSALVLAGCTDAGGGGAEPTPSGDQAGGSQSAASPSEEATPSNEITETPASNPPSAPSIEGRGITPGAASNAWRSAVYAKSGKDFEHNCVDNLLDQTTLDAVATFMPNAGGVYGSQIFAGRDHGLEFVNCTFLSVDAVAGQPSVYVSYRHSTDESTLPECSVVAPHDLQEHSWDPETGDGLGAATDPGFIDGPTSLTFLPQRSAWHCTEDGKTSVGVVFGAQEGYGDEAVGLDAIQGSDIAYSTQLVEEARDSLAANLEDRREMWTSAIDEIAPVVGEFKPGEGKAGGDV